MRRSTQHAEVEDRRQGSPRPGRSSPPPPRPSARAGREGGSRGLRGWSWGSRRPGDAGAAACGPKDRRPGRLGLERSARSLLLPWLSGVVRAEEAAARGRKRASVEAKPALGAAHESN
uniref:TNF receptor associated factor 6 n=1 Tax=Myotis myotis TaxID=51298 RepID=A0A7J7VLM7_MYOMY|nr:TNF receptor associated factor 6 [Myotis myotis]